MTTIPWVKEEMIKIGKFYYCYTIQEDSSVLVHLFGGKSIMLMDVVTMKMPVVFPKYFRKNKDRGTK